MDELATGINTPTKTITGGTEKEVLVSSEDSDSKASLSVKFPLSAGADLGIGDKTQVSSSVESTDNITYEDKINLASVNRMLNTLVSELSERFYLLLDEWSSIPMDVQPYLASLIKRGILPASSITVKIAALEFRSNFLYGKNGNPIGMEIGADIATTPTLDSYYRFEYSGAELENDFSEMLYLHISSELDFHYLRKQHRVSDGATMMDTIFEEGAFNTLAQASEGVIRDLINIFIISFTRANKPRFDKKLNKISAILIYESAKQWFERDKSQALDPDIIGKYNGIIQISISRNKNRYFLVPSDLAEKTTLDRLVDLRILHLVSKKFGVMKADSIETFDVYSIDFGSYATFLTFDARSKHLEMPFFDKNTFSKYPDPTGDLSSYNMDLGHIS